MELNENHLVTIVCKSFFSNGVGGQIQVISSVTHDWHNTAVNGFTGSHPFSRFSGKHRPGNDSVNAQHCPAISCNLTQLPPLHVYWTIYAEPQQKSYWEKQSLIITITDFNTKIQHFMHLRIHFPAQTKIWS